jgi:hypothetical protein
METLIKQFALWMGALFCLSSVVSCP